MGRFVNEPQAYQKHHTIEQYEDYPPVERSWIEYVSPRKEIYTKPVFVLVGRWTGSMGEGMAIGFDAIIDATIVGTEMERLAGEMEGFSFKHRDYGYQLSTAKLYHINGTPREKFVPEVYVQQTKLSEDKTLQKAMELIQLNQK